MSYEVVFSESFQKSIKRYKKRYRNVKKDVEQAIDQILESPQLGDVIPNGFDTRKLRVRNRDIRKGKRAGYRLIYYGQDEPEPILYLLLLYLKADKSDVSRPELERLLKDLDLWAG